MQPADGDAVAADFRVRAGDLVMHDAGVVYQQVPRMDGLPLIVDQILALSADNQADFHKILMGMQDARVHACARRDIRDIEQARIVLPDKNRLDALFGEALYVERLILHCFNLLQAENRFLSKCGTATELLYRGVDRLAVLNYASISETLTQRPSRAEVAIASRIVST